jgi:hypothetical protein
LGVIGLGGNAGVFSFDPSLLACLDFSDNGEAERFNEDQPY